MEIAGGDNEIKCTPNGTDATEGPLLGERCKLVDEHMSNEAAESNEKDSSEDSMRGLSSRQEISVPSFRAPAGQKKVFKLPGRVRSVGGGAVGATRGPQGGGMEQKGLQGIHVCKIRSPLS